jgi:hypothetical protein
MRSDCMPYLVNALGDTLLAIADKQHGLDRGRVFPRQPCVPM